MKTTLLCAFLCAVSLQTLANEATDLLPPPSVLGEPYDVTVDDEGEPIAQCDIETECFKVGLSLIRKAKSAPECRAQAERVGSDLENPDMDMTRSDSLLELKKCLAGRKIARKKRARVVRIKKALGLLK